MKFKYKSGQPLLITSLRHRNYYRALGRSLNYHDYRNSFGPRHTLPVGETLQAVFVDMWVDSDSIIVYFPTYDITMDINIYDVRIELKSINYNDYWAKLNEI